MEIKKKIQIRQMNHSYYNRRRLCVQRNVTREKIIFQSIRRNVFIYIKQYVFTAKKCSTCVWHHFEIIFHINLNKKSFSGAFFGGRGNEISNWNAISRVTKTHAALCEIEQWTFILKKLFHTLLRALFFFKRNPRWAPSRLSTLALDRLKANAWKIVTRDICLVFTFIFHAFLHVLSVCSSFNCDCVTCSFSFR